MAIEKMTSQTFNEKIKGNPGLTVIDFSATWCGPCKMLSPILEDASLEHTDVAFYKVDVDEELQLATAFQIMSVPTLLFFKDGAAVKKSIGLISPEELDELIAACK